MSTSEKFTSNKSYKKAEFFHLSNAKIEQFQTNITEGEDSKSFQVLTERKSFVFIAESEQEKQVWIDLITNAILAAKKSISSSTKPTDEQETFLSPVW